MKTFARVFGPLALAGTIVPPLLFAAGLMTEEHMKAIMFAAAVTWFIAAPFWLTGTKD